MARCRTQTMEIRPPQCNSSPPRCDSSPLRCDAAPKQWKFDRHGAMVHLQGGNSTATVECSIAKVEILRCRGWKHSCKKL